MDNFGVICKGKSLERLTLVSDNFTDCFIVNYFEKELEKFSNIFQSKNIIQFVNRRGTIRMPKRIYEKFNITELQYNLPERIKGQKTELVDKKTKKRLREYSEFNLKLNFLPEELLVWNKFFRPYENYPNEYTFKHPNTGIQACIYAAQIVRPKNLYIIGLDFYQDDYLYRREVCNPLKVQQKKMKRCHMIEHFEFVINSFIDINWFIVTNYKRLKHKDHVKLL